MARVSSQANGPLPSSLQPAPNRHVPQFIAAPHSEYAAISALDLARAELCATPGRMPNIFLSYISKSITHLNLLNLLSSATFSTRDDCFAPESVLEKSLRMEGTLEANS